MNGYNKNLRNRRDTLAFRSRVPGRNIIDQIPPGAVADHSFVKLHRLRDDKTRMLGKCRSGTIMPITVGNLGPLLAVSKREADVVFCFESSDLVVMPLLPNLVRHTWVPTHWRLYTERITEGCAVRHREWPAAPHVKIVESPDSVSIRAGELLIEATRDPFHLRYSTSDGQVFLEEAEAGGLSWSYWDYALTYALKPEDHFYGMGQADQLAHRVVRG